MNYLKTSLGFLFSIILAISSSAQMSPNADIPLNPKVTHGQLDNGMHYYIQHNETATDRAEFYLVNNVGAIDENDNQNGLAHFCEHMAFNGTQIFPEKGILEFMERNGVKFGHNVNAGTGMEQTVYMLSGVPVNKAGLVDSSLLVLKEWAHNVSYKEEEIDKERGVIHEEWRTRRNANFRLRDAHRPILWQGSKYAKRNVIGELDVIDNCEYETLRSFYRDWYRPELQAVIVVGDIDQKEVEAKVKELFSAIPAKKNPRPKETFNVPDHKEPLISVAKDKEATNVMFQLVFKHAAVKAEDKNMEYYYNQLQYNLISTMMINRFNEMRQSENPPFLYAYAFYGNLVKTKNAFMGMLAANPTEPMISFKAFYSELMRMDQHGFTETELERAKQDLLRRFEKNYNERNKRDNRSIVNDYTSHYLRNEPAAGPEYDYKWAQKVIPNIEIENINKIASGFVTDENMVVTLSAPDAESITVPTEKEIKMAIDEVRKEKTEVYEDDALDIPLMASIPEAGKILKHESNKDFGFEEIVFENGARILVKNTNFKDDEIRFTAFSKGGKSLYEIEELFSADYSANLADASGLGEFSAVQLDKKLSGKMVSLRPYVSTYHEGFSGSTTPEDLETFMKILNMYFTDVRVDEAAYNSFLKRQRALLERKYSNPRAVAMDTFQGIYYSHHPYYQPVTTEKLDQINYERAMEIFRERFKNAGDFTYVFVGNIDMDEFMKLAAVYIGSVEAGKKEEYKELDVNYPEGHVKKHYTHKMEIPKSTVTMIYHGEMEYSLKNEIIMSMLEHALDLKYTEIIREEMGGTYGVSIFGGLNKTPHERYQLFVLFDCDPERVNSFVKVIHDQVNEVAENGPEKTAITKAKENLIKKHQESLEKNGAWLNMLKEYAQYNQEPVTGDDYIKLVRSITAEDIQKMAKTLKNKHVTETVMNPEM